jgi:hypothetical protein
VGNSAKRGIASRPPTDQEVAGARLQVAHYCQQNFEGDDQKVGCRLLLEMLGILPDQADRLQQYSGSTLYDPRHPSVVRSVMARME